MTDLRSRLVLALLDALKDEDPSLIIGVGDQELKIGWWPMPNYCNRCGRPHDGECLRDKARWVDPATGQKGCACNKCMWNEMYKGG